MNSLETLYFPGTAITSHRQLPVFLLFDKIRLIKPVEGPTGGTGDKISDSFINSGFCQVDTPCPLGKDRDRFLRLVGDIKARRDDYAAQLSSLTLAAMSERKITGDDSERAIINSLITPKDLTDKANEQEQAEILWQARLVLAIGEILDQEEEEVAHQLDLLEHEESSLFKELHGELDDIDEEDRLFADQRQRRTERITVHAGNMRKRLRAWRQLFQKSDYDKYDVLLTTSSDAGDILIEQYEQQTNTPPPLIFSLDLPARLGAVDQQSIDMVKEFHTANRDLIEDFHGILQAMVNEPLAPGGIPQQQAAVERFTTLWTERLTTLFPTERSGRMVLRAYLFPQHSAQLLLGSHPGKGEPKRNGLLLIAD